MTEGSEVLVKNSFADLTFANKQDVGMPVKVVKVTEREGILPLIKIRTVSGQLLELFLDAFLFIKSIDISSYWKQWMEKTLSISSEFKGGLAVTA